MTSYRDLDREADDLAMVLGEVGVGRGDRVVVPAASKVETVAVLWAVPRAGAIAVPLDPRLPAGQVAATGELVGARALWEPGHRPEPLPPAGRVPRGPGGEGPPAADARFLVATSGTTGSPRLAMITGGNIAAAAAASAARLGNGPGDRWLCVLPLHHIGGLSILWRSAREGGTVVLPGRFSAAEAAGLLAGGSIGLASLVPTMLHRVLAVSTGPFPGVRAVLVGGGPADPSLLARARAAGLPVLATYGMTETCSQAATEAPDDVGAVTGSAGRPLGSCEVRVAGKSGRPLPPGKAGRIEVRGPAVSPGYWGERARRPAQWLATGDIGYLDPEGRLFVLGRADDAIITGGETVHPAAVEAALRAHPLVADARVFGEPDPEWGTRVAAEVAAEPGAVLRPEDLAAFARGLLAPAAVPRRWAVVGEIPRSEMGKIRRGGPRGRSGGDPGWAGDAPPRTVTPKGDLR